MKVQRERIFSNTLRAIKENPVTALLGSRQSGKTTLAKDIAQKFSDNGKVHFFDLEHPEDLCRLENPLRALEGLEGLIIIDEVQRKPDLFPLLRVLADKDPLPAKFLVLGSASGQLLQQTSESLAGRIEYIELPGFGIDEVEDTLYNQLWVRGSYPKAFLAETAEQGYRWRERFMQTFLEKDIGMFGLRVSPTQIWRFWKMLAHYHGQTCNYSEIGKSLGISHNTVRNYLDLLTDTFMVRQLPPWFENVGKTMVKSPKIYIRDSGLLHNLFSIKSMDELRSHPKLGASWEGFALEQIIRLSEQNRNAFFWATHGGAEIDLVINFKGQLWGFEIKYADTPKQTKSISIALESLQLEKIFIVYPGQRNYAISDTVEALPLMDLFRIFQ